MFVDKLVDMLVADADAGADVDADANARKRTHVVNCGLRTGGSRGSTV